MSSVMIDVETTGTRPGSAIRSIGACEFELDGQGVRGTFYQNVDHQSCVDVGLTSDAATERWWAEQDPDAVHFLQDDQISIRVVLQRFTHWWTENFGEHVWSHGAGFDVVLVESAYRACDLTPPWKFWNICDTRTVFYLMGFDTKSYPFVGTRHNALHDAVHQAKCVQAALRPRWKL